MLLKTWFSLISGILIVTLFILLFNFKLTNPLHWLYFIAILIAIILQCIVFLEQPHKKEAKKLEKAYADFIKHKDKQIEGLHEKGSLLFKTAIKKAEADVELAEMKRRMEERN